MSTRDRPEDFVVTDDGYVYTAERYGIIQRNAERRAAKAQADANAKANAEAAAAAAAAASQKVSTAAGCCY